MTGSDRSEYDELLDKILEEAESRKGRTPVTMGHWRDGARWAIEQARERLDEPEILTDGGTEQTGSDHAGTFDIPLGPHRVPMIQCSNCGTEHHPDAARRLSGEFRPQCRECSAFLREATESEERKFTDFIVWNGRHLDRDRDGPELVTDGGVDQPGKHLCRNCGQRFYRPTEAGVPSCPEGAIHVAEEDGLRVDGSGEDKTVRHPDYINSKIDEIRSYDDYGTGPSADNLRYKHQGWIDALLWVLGSDLGVEP